jgi:hypothetical protein
MLRITAATDGDATVIVEVGTNAPVSQKDRVTVHNPQSTSGWTSSIYCSIICLGIR